MSSINNNNNFTDESTYISFESRHSLLLSPQSIHEMQIYVLLLNRKTKYF